jgi:FemAB-related protein (PEP-CTERM system-associated)
MARLTAVGVDDTDLFTGSAEDWDRFVKTQRGWTHFHLYGWRQVIKQVFGHECVYLACSNAAGTLTGVLPLVQVKSRIFGHYLVSMPFLNYGGPLGTDASIEKLAGTATDIAKDLAVDLLELRSLTELPLDLRVSHRKITVLLDLPSEGPEHLMSQFKAKLRSQIRRPQKEGVEARFGQDQVDSFYRVFSQHMRDLGTPTLPRRFFDAIADTFGESVWFGCAYMGEYPIACGCGFEWDEQFEMTWASSLVRYNRIAPNMLLYWGFMERAIERGLKIFNFGRCTPESGTHRFKKQWGSRDVPLFWYQFRKDEASSTPSPDDSRYSWGPRLWRHLPLPIANAVGPRIVRNIP